MGSEYLAENLLSNLEVLVQIKVLEKAFGIKSVFSYDVLKTEHDVLNCSALISSGLTASVDC